MTNLGHNILYLSEQDVKCVCEDIDSISIISAALALHASGNTALPEEAYLNWMNDHGEVVRSLNMPSSMGGLVKAVGTKIINANPHNPTRNLPRASGLTILFDIETARVTCIMEGAHISALRTASITALTSDLLRGRAIECLALIGAGVLAQAHLKLLPKKLQDLCEVTIFDIDRNRAQRLWEEFAPTLRAQGICLRVVDTAEDAIRRAQLIVPVTTTTCGYIHLKWLRPGALIVNISLDDPLPEVVLAADKVIVDDWNLVKNDTRRLLGKMYRDGQIADPGAPKTKSASCRRIDAEIGEIIVGSKPGRRHNDEIILVNPFGLSIEDIALAAKVYEVATQLGLGTRLTR